ncbi:MAG: hypothetical protein KDD50_11300 [Bdellovibrionales bacterium]|nr:hypothetical protein [Bdellovibrionales bacterium]
MTDTTVKKKRGHDSNRLTLSKKSQEKAKDWLSQLSDEFNGMVNLKRNDLLNFLIEEMEDKLSQALMDKIKNEKLTDKEKAKWIYQKFLDAEKQGLELDFNELVKTAQGNIKRERKPRKTQNKNSQNQENKVSKTTAIDAENVNNIK